MFLCYLDESGTVDPGTTSHFVLLGLALRAERWRGLDAEIEAAKAAYRLKGAELHTAFIYKRFPEQERLAGFGALDDAERRRRMLEARRQALLVAPTKKKAALLKKEYAKTDAYVHLTLDERRAFVTDVADRIARSDVRLFCEAVSKGDSSVSPTEVFGLAFEQVVTRFHAYLEAIGADSLGLLVQDNNETASKHLTGLMRKYHEDGRTRWGAFRRVIETPLFVDSELTSMVQLADMCSYATRRFFENGETHLFDRIYDRFDRTRKLVGLRHYTGKRTCSCRVCVDHGR